MDFSIRSEFWWKVLSDEKSNRVFEGKLCVVDFAERVGEFDFARNQNRINVEKCESNLWNKKINSEYKIDSYLIVENNIFIK